MLKYLLRRTPFDKVLRDEAFNIVENPKCDEYQKGLASMVYKFFNKKSTSGGGVKNEIMPNQELAEESYKPTISKVEKQKVHLSFIHIIWCADLSDMQLIGKFKKEICFLLCVTDFF